MRKHFAAAIVAALLAATAIANTPAPALAADGYVCEGRVAYRIYSDHAEVWDYLDQGITNGEGTARFIAKIERNARDYNKTIVDWDYSPTRYAGNGSSCPWQVTFIESDGSWWTFSMGEQWKQTEPYAIASEANTGTDLVIPRTVEGKPVTALRTLAFGAPFSTPRDNSCMITSIQLPEGITAIPNDAFSACAQLRTVKLPDSLTAIGSYAFYTRSTITNINVPASLNTVGKGAFDGCNHAVQAKFAKWTTASSGGSGSSGQQPKQKDPVGTMYRLYNPNSGEHFYTSSAGERDSVKAAGWTYEGIGWTAPTSGRPVFRLYNKYGGEHHYTLSTKERDDLVSLGWTYEGVGWRSGGSTPLWRQYNPNEFANNHNYTVSTHERDTIVGLGWRDEGVAWYGL